MGSTRGNLKKHEGAGGIEEKRRESCRLITRAVRREDDKKTRRGLKKLLVGAFYKYVFRLRTLAGRTNATRIVELELRSVFKVATT